MKIKNFLANFANLNVGLWLGMMVFFSALFAPTVFQTLSREEAALLQNTLFPKYYAAGVVFFILAFASGWLRYSRLMKVLLLVCGNTFAFGLLFLTPYLKSVRTINPEAFAFFHKLSVVLNLEVLILLVVLFWSSTPKPEINDPSAA